MSINYTLLFLSLGALYCITIEAVTLRCYNGSFNNTLDFNITDPVPFLSSSCYNASKNTTAYTFGAQGRADGLSVQTVTEAFLPTNNVLLVNWETEASGGILGFLAYPKIVINGIKVGQQFGEALIKLVNAGLNGAGIRLVGFSLGAHVMGNAAKVYQQTGRNISNLIGLDPAGPGYEGIGLVGYGLDASNAKCVSVVHTNAGRMGTYESIGTVNFWPNCGSPLQPGCTGSSLIITSDANMCSHNRSWMYYPEAWTRPNTLTARLCDSCDDFKAGRGTNRTLSMEECDEFGAGANYYLTTNSIPFYGREQAGFNP